MKIKKMYNRIIWATSLALCETFFPIFLLRNLDKTLNTSFVTHRDVYNDKQVKSPSSEKGKGPARQFAIFCANVKFFKAFHFILLFQSTSSVLQESIGFANKGITISSA